jgi:hypothetical protein
LKFIWDGEHGHVILDDLKTVISDDLKTVIPDLIRDPWLARAMDPGSSPGVTKSAVIPDFYPGGQVLVIPDVIRDPGIRHPGLDPGSITTP